MRNVLLLLVVVLGCGSSGAPAKNGAPDGGGGPGSGGGTSGGSDGGGSGGSAGSGGNGGAGLTCTAGSQPSTTVCARLDGCYRDPLAWTCDPLTGNWTCPGGTYPVTQAQIAQACGGGGGGAGARVDASEDVAPGN
jgi:hypothetical protein